MKSGKPARRTRADLLAMARMRGFHGVTRLPKESLARVVDGNEEKAFAVSLGCF